MSAQNPNNPNTTQFTASTAPGSDGGDAFLQLNPANSNQSELPTPAPPSNTLTARPISPSSDTHEPSKIHPRNASVSHINQSVDDTPHLKTPPHSSQLSQASMSPVSPNNGTAQRVRVTPLEAASTSLEHSRLPYDEDSDTEWSPDEDCDGPSHFNPPPHSLPSSWLNFIFRHFR